MAKVLEQRMTPDQILSKIVAWATVDTNVRSLVLVGSRASGGSDELADFDVQVFVGTSEPYTRDDAWLSEVAPVWVRVQDHYRYGEIVVPTELVIFAEAVKVDFAFYPASVMADVIRDSPAYRVLVDKDGGAGNAECESSRQQSSRRPSEAEFTNVVHEFWFEAYHVAKYLARGELWLVKARDWATKERLLTMLEWREQAGHLSDAGKHMRSWVSGEVWENLHGVFAHFDSEDSWRALLATTDLFRQLARETAGTLGFTYPDDVDRNISGFILRLKGSGSVRSS